VIKLAVPAVLLSAALGMAAAPGAASAATSAGVKPDTLTTCQSNGNGTLCFEIDGSGNNVNFMKVTMSWSGTHKNTYLKIVYTPTGSPSYKSATGTNESSFLKNFDHSENSGQWCGIAYQDTTNEAESCVIND
jgi:hypothetical protein